MRGEEFWAEAFFEWEMPPKMGEKRLFDSILVIFWSGGAGWRFKPLSGGGGILEQKGVWAMGVGGESNHPPLPTVQ